MGMSSSNESARRHHNAEKRGEMLDKMKSMSMDGGCGDAIGISCRTRSRIISLIAVSVKAA